MIYLNEKVMNIQDYFKEGNFTKKNDNYYFVVEEIEKNVFLCVKLFDSLKYEHKIEVIEVETEKNKVKREKRESKEENIDYALEEFFSFLFYVENPEDIKISKKIFNLIEKYFERAYFYSEKNKLIAEFMEIFEISGKICEGVYSNTVKLTNIVLKNKVTGQIIENLNEVYFEKMIDIDEDEDVDYIFEALADSMIEYEIKEMLKKSWKK
jgi:hypothetical protein